MNERIGKRVFAFFITVLFDVLIILLGILRLRHPVRVRSRTAKLKKIEDTMFLVLGTFNSPFNFKYER